MTTEQQEAVKYLKKTLKNGEEIYTQTEYGRNYYNAYTKLFIARGNKIINITWDVAQVLDVKLKNGRLPYGDFDSVYNLGRVLYPKGYKHTAKGCRSNDHVNFNDYDNTYHKDGGYRFRNRSL